MRGRGSWTRRGVGRSKPIKARPSLRTLSASLYRGISVRICCATSTLSWLLELEAIEYASSATINLAYKREDIPHPLNGFGFVVPFVEKRTVMACTFSSEVCRTSARVTRCCAPLLAAHCSRKLSWLGEASLLSAVRADLRDLLGIEQPPLFAEVMRWERSMPQYHVGHLAQ